MTPARRLLLVCSVFHPARGGHAIRLRRLSHALAAHGVAVDVVTTNWLAWDAPAVEREGHVEVRRVRDHLFVVPTWRVFRRLRREGRRYDALLVDEPSRRHVVVARLARRLFRAPAFFMISGTESETTAPWAKRAAAAMSERLICLSGYARDAYGHAPEKAVIIPPGPGVDWPDDPARLPPVEGRRPLVLAVARIDRRKGHETLLRAAVLARQRLDPPPDFILAGGMRERAYLDELEALRRELGLEEGFRFEIEVEDDRLVELYGEASCFALHTHHEMFGIVFVEAMFAGLPIVSTRCAAVPEVVRPEFGRLAPPGDPEAFADALVEVLSDESRRLVLARAARAAAPRYRWPPIAARFIETLFPSLDCE